MLRNSSRYKQRKQHRYNERFKLQLIATGGPILPYHYTRPSTDPLGIDATAVNTTDYDNIRSTSPICDITPRTIASDGIHYNSSSDYTSDGSSSISVYTVRLYNRLEGRWENPRPNSILYPQAFEEWADLEDERLFTETHGPHSILERPHYVEYHRLRVYTNDSDSSFTLHSTSSDTTTFSFDSTNEDNRLNNEYISQLFEGSNPNYWPDYGTHFQQRIELEYDSDGDFPFPVYPSKGKTATSSSQSPTAGYATQDDYSTPNLSSHYQNTKDPVTGREIPYSAPSLWDLNYSLLPITRLLRPEHLVTQTTTNETTVHSTSSSSSTSVDLTELRLREYEDHIYSDPPTLDDTLDPVTFRYNHHHWRSINGHTTAPSYAYTHPTLLTTSTFPLTEKTSESAPHQQHAPEPRVTTTTTRITTTETRPHSSRINPLPTFGTRQYLPILAARKSTYDSGAPVRHVIKTPVLNRPGLYKTAHLRSNKCVSLKTTRTNTPLLTRARTSSGATPDTTVPPTYTTPTKRRKYRHTNRRVLENNASSSDSSLPTQQPSRSKRDPNA